MWDSGAVSPRRGPSSACATACLYPPSQSNIKAFKDAFATTAVALLLRPHCNGAAAGLQETLPLQLQKRFSAAEATQGQSWCCQTTAPAVVGTSAIGTHLPVCLGPRQKNARRQLAGIAVPRLWCCYNRVTQSAATCGQVGTCKIMNFTFYSKSNLPACETASVQQRHCVIS